MSLRLAKLRSQFDALHIDAFLVTFLPHLRYLTGFTGSNGIGFVTRETATIVTDGRYTDQVRQEVRGWKAFITHTSLFDAIRAHRVFRPGMRVGFDGNTLVYNQIMLIRKRFPRVKFLPKADTIERIASVKDESEIGSIRKAVEITDRVFEEVVNLIKPGMSELDVGAEISYRQRKHGAEADAFETIVASGLRGSLPHGRASSKNIKRGELVTLDFGCVFEGYHSDMTRTIAVGRPSSEARRMYETVFNAQLQAIESARAGIHTRELDAIARSYIKRNGYEKYFRHSLGHGIGLQIHEAPRISVMSTAILERGNVITIEPGIYNPSIGGVRIEDDVVIRNGHCEVLNRSPKELLVL
jgi:Xaa-Pro aminopeptidase